MDLHLETDADHLKRIFADLGFTVQEQNGYVSAVREKGQGRLHAAFVETNRGLYCDLHYDHPIHFLLFGVDYKKRPKHFFDTDLKQTLDQEGIAFAATEVNWFTRRNKAIFRGFR